MKKNILLRFINRNTTNGFYTVMASGLLHHVGQTEADTFSGMDNIFTCYITTPNINTFINCDITTQQNLLKIFLLNNIYYIL